MRRSRHRPGRVVFEGDTQDPLAALYAAMNPRLRFDAMTDEHVLREGSLVYRLADLSGNDDHALASGSLRPTYTTSEGVAGRGSVRFTGGLRALVVDALSLGSSTSGVIVWRCTGNDQTAFGFGPSLDSHTDVFTEGGQVKVRSSGGGGGGDITAGITYLFDMTLVWRLNPTSSRVLFNGTAVSGGALGSPAAATGPLSLGSAGGVYPLNGAIGEFVLSEDAWSDAFMDEVRLAMVARWFT